MESPSAERLIEMMAEVDVALEGGPASTDAEQRRRAHVWLQEHGHGLLAAIEQLQLQNERLDRRWQMRCYHPDCDEPMSGATIAPLMLTYCPTHRSAAEEMNGASRELAALRIEKLRLGRLVEVAQLAAETMGDLVDNAGGYDSSWLTVARRAVAVRARSEEIPAAREQYATQVEELQKREIACRNAWRVLTDALSVLTKEPADGEHAHGPLSG
jgi:hypothetical protein